eukprot:1032611_1
MVLQFGWFIHAITLFHAWFRIRCPITADLIVFQRTNTAWAVRGTAARYTFILIKCIKTTAYCMTWNNKINIAITTIWNMFKIENASIIDLAQSSITKIIV